MSFILHNANPCNERDIDCTVRAISILLNASWDDIYWGLCIQGNRMCRMPSSQPVVNEFLYNEGFDRYIIPNTCPFCYSVRDFTDDHQNGFFLLCTDSHVVPVINGDYIDTWDSGSEIPIYYWAKGG